MGNKKYNLKKRHQDRDDLAGEHALGDIIQLIFFLSFLLIWILDCFVFKYSTFLSEYVPIFIRVPVAVAVLIASGLLASSGLKTVFGKTQEKPQVITTGVFFIVRHPIYLGSILLYLGLIISKFSLLSFLLWIAIVVFYYMISQYEEKLLIDKFGQKYEEYKKRVPMLIPIKLIKKQK